MKEIKQFNQFKTIAVLQTAFIGDTMLSVLFLDYIKRQHPDCHVIFITLPQYSSFLELSTSIDKLIYLDKRGEHKSISGLRKFSNELSKLKIDLFISLHKSARSSFIASSTKADYKISYDISAFSSFVYKKRIKYQAHKHELMRFIDLLSSFDSLDDYIYQKADLNFADVPEKEKISAELDNNKIKIIVCPGSVWATKRWSKEYFRDLVHSFDKEKYQIILSGGNSEKELCEFIAQDSHQANNQERNQNRNIIIHSGDLSLAQSLYLYSQCDLIISNDSAPIHIAALVNVPTIAIFGPTDPIFGFSPLADESKSIYIKDMDCRPCEIHGSNQCPIQTHDCMNNILPKQIFDEAELILDTDTRH